jgi:hypothetical protein
METKPILIRDSKGTVRTDFERYHTFRHGNPVEWTEEDGTVHRGIVLRSERNLIIVADPDYDPLKVYFGGRREFWLRKPKAAYHGDRFCLKGRKVQIPLRHAE